MKLLNLSDLLNTLPEPVYARRYLSAFLTDASEQFTAVIGADQRVAIAGETLTFPSHVILDDARFTRWHETTVRKIEVVLKEGRVIKAEDLKSVDGMTEAVFRHLAEKQRQARTPDAARDEAQPSMTAKRTLARSDAPEQPQKQSHEARPATAVTEEPVAAPA